MGKIKKFNRLELSEATINRILDDAKYYEALNTFDVDISDKRFLTFGDSKYYRLGAINILEELKMQDDIEYADLVSLKMILGGIFTNRHLNPWLINRYSKVIKSLYIYDRDAFIKYEEDILNMVISLQQNRVYILEILELYSEMIQKNTDLDEYSMYIGKEHLNSTINLLNNNESLEYSKNIHIAKKINVHHSINETLREKCEEEYDYDALVDYIAENLENLLDILKIHLNFIASDCYEEALKYKADNVDQYIINGEDLNRNRYHYRYEIMREQGIDFFNLIDWYSKHKNRTYNIDFKYNPGLEYMVNCFSTDIIPKPIYDYIDEFRSAVEIENPNLADEDEADEFTSEFVDGFTTDAMYELQSYEFELVDSTEVSSPFIEDLYDEKRIIDPDIDLLYDINGFIYTDRLIEISSESINKYIEKYLDDKEKLNTLLNSFEKLLLEYCDEFYTLSVPKIRKKRNIGVEICEYTIASFVIYNEHNCCSLYNSDIAKKRIHMADYEKIKSVLDIHDEIELLLLI